MSDEPLTDDPRFEGMPAATVESAKQAKCARCETVVVEAGSIMGTVMVNYYVPALSVRRREILCGLCGLDFREFLHPWLKGDGAFQASKALLVEEFSR